jgi:hypothetical protein
MPRKPRESREAGARPSVSATTSVRAQEALAEPIVGRVPTWLENRGRRRARGAVASATVARITSRASPLPLFAESRTQSRAPSWTRALEPKISRALAAVRDGCSHSLLCNPPRSSARNMPMLQSNPAPEERREGQHRAPGGTCHGRCEEQVFARQAVRRPAEDRTRRASEAVTPSAENVKTGAGLFRHGDHPESL